jgi:tetratricopeptide (TPR) repeat protein
MEIIDKLLRVREALCAGNCGLAIAEMEVYLQAWPHPQTMERLQQLKEDYGRMTEYWRTGGNDPQLDQLYQQLLQRMYVIFANVSIYNRTKASAFLNGLFTRVRKEQSDWSLKTVRQEMENFVSSVAMLQLEPEHTRQQQSETLYKAHQQQMSRLFDYVLTSRQWSEGVGRDFEELLVSPTIDSIDQQLITSAVMLSLMNQYDMVKFRTLTGVYRRSHDTAVRQRALVGWVMALDHDFGDVYPEQRELVRQLVKSDAVCRELTELQIQLVYCLNADRDTNTIQKEIMPELLNNNSFRVNNNRIEEVDDDPMEDILHPGASEERMEKMEATFQRMVNMQKAGSDIYFAGFSQMKRFPFFYDISNWLVPFYIQHPDIAQFVNTIGATRFIERLMQQDAFCNSDKYSFVIAFHQVMNRLPDSIIEMVKHGEGVMGMETGEEETSTPAFIRRSYLMDLYRFFRLFPNRSEIKNPFDTSRNPIGGCEFFSSPMFVGTPMEAFKREIVRVYRKHRQHGAATLLLSTFPEEMYDVQYYLWTGDYVAVLALDPDNERALVGHARQLFAEGAFDEASECYDRLQQLYPDKSSYQLNKAVCLLQQDDYEEALQLLFKLNYEHPDDSNVCRVLAWAMTCAGKLEQAARHYEYLVKGKQVADEDLQNYGYCLWLQGHVDEAAQQLSRYAETIKEKNGAPALPLLDEAWLMKRGISATEIKMMQALVSA